MMSPTAQHIALLESMGIRHEHSWPIDVGEPEGVIMYPCWVWPDGEKQRDMPDLTLDLMASAEAKLTTTEDIELWVGYLSMGVARATRPNPWGTHDLIRATKEQRLEAYLKTVGKWVDKGPQND